ncbi:hypothetical protein GQ53DRAFT_753686 [Thozetella sp. PMI_491]|nr:hypothetical protein GQ53DRAFT_753686 [Thozetella sp. PMI_491]
MSLFFAYRRRRRNQPEGLPHWDNPDRVSSLPDQQPPQPPRGPTEPLAIERPNRGSQWRRNASRESQGGIVADQLPSTRYMGDKSVLEQQVTPSRDPRAPRVPRESISRWIRELEAAGPPSDIRPDSLPPTGSPFWPPRTGPTDQPVFMPRGASPVDQPAYMPPAERRMSMAVPVTLIPAWFRRGLSMLSSNVSETSSVSSGFLFGYEGRKIPAVQSFPPGSPFPVTSPEGELHTRPRGIMAEPVSPLSAGAPQSSEHK